MVAKGGDVLGRRSVVRGIGIATTLALVVIGIRSIRELDAVAMSVVAVSGGEAMHENAVARLAIEAEASVDSVVVDDILDQTPALERRALDSVRLRGVLIEAGGAAPVAGCAVVFEPIVGGREPVPRGPIFTTETGGDGGFALDVPGAVACAYQISLRKHGYVALRRVFEIGDVDLSRDLGEIDMHRCFRVEVSVRDHEFRPIEGCRLSFHKLGFRSKQESSTGVVFERCHVSNQRTDRNGRFLTAFELAIGTWQMRVGKRFVLVEPRSPTVVVAGATRLDLVICQRGRVLRDMGGGIAKLEAPPYLARWGVRLDAVLTGAGVEQLRQALEEERRAMLMIQNPQIADLNVRTREVMIRSLELGCYWCEEREPAKPGVPSYGPSEANLAVPGYVVCHYDLEDAGRQKRVYFYMSTQHF